MNTDQLLSRFRQLYYVLLQGGGWGEVKRLMKRHHLIAFDTREKGTKGGGGESVKEGETRQENRAKPTMGRDLACGHVHERHVWWNEMMERCKELSISLVPLGRRSPRDHR